MSHLLQQIVNCDDRRIASSCRAVTRWASARPAPDWAFRAGAVQARGVEGLPAVDAAALFRAVAARDFREVGVRVGLTAVGAEAVLTAVVAEAVLTAVVAEAVLTAVVAEAHFLAAAAEEGQVGLIAVEGGALRGVVAVGVAQLGAELHSAAAGAETIRPPRTLPAHQPQNRSIPTPCQKRHAKNSTKCSRVYHTR